ncbi:ATP-binding cassette domain-containing protein [Shimia sp. R9_2]|uniref:ATP-binding cassette domain-containing protein n=1 Tax=Shimia sp. R9_2 TaxID=2821112 RepID=UPI0032AE9DEC
MEAQRGGKTTTRKAIIGQWTAKSGDILYDGPDITRLPSSRRARAGIGFVPEDMGVFSDMTVEEYMVLGCTPGQLDPKRKE